MTPEISFQTISHADVVDIALQRTGQLRVFPIVGSPAYWAWLKGRPELLKRQARRRRQPILEGAMHDIAAEFGTVGAYLGDRELHRVVDIGCGHAFMDILFWKRYGCSVHLVDIEETSATHHGYSDTGAGYASLASARAFLIDNGMPDNEIATTNPSLAGSTLVDRDVDLIISSISAGFHYPIGMYTDFALDALKPGGVLIFDARNGTDQESALDGFSRVDVIAEAEKHRRLAAIK